MTSLILNYPPNSNITLKITASNILTYYDHFMGDKFLFEINNNGNYEYLIDLGFRECIKGEIYRPELYRYAINLNSLGYHLSFSFI